MMGKKSSKSKTRLKNLTDSPVDIQIRVGSILMKAYTLKPGCSKTLRRSNIYRSYSIKGESSFFSDGSCEPYVWIHCPTHAAKYFISPMAAKQQYISLDDLREYLEIEICMDGGNASFSVLKISRSYWEFEACIFKSSHVQHTTLFYRQYFIASTMNFLRFETDLRWYNSVSEENFIHGCSNTAEHSGV